MKPEMEVDIKLLCYKPIVVFSQCLKIFGNFQKIEHPVTVLKRSQKTGLISFYATTLLTEMLKFASKLRAKLHLSENYPINGEKKEFHTFSEQDKSFIEFCRTIFGRMKKSLEIMIFDGGYEKFQNWNSVMLSLSRDLILHAVQVRDIFSVEPWITCLEELPVANGTRESTKVWNLEKEKVLDCLLPKFSDEVFQNAEFAKTPPIMVDRIKGTILPLQNKEGGGRRQELGGKRQAEGGGRKAEGGGKGWGGARAGVEGEGGGDDHLIFNGNLLQVDQFSALVCIQLYHNNLQKMDLWTKREISTFQVCNLPKKEEDTL
jgi:hypothetical protein